MFVTHSDDTARAILGQYIGSRHTPKFNASVVGQLVESLKSEVESARCGIYSENVDSRVNAIGLVV
jgi:hypothetical protein